MGEERLSAQIPASSTRCGLNSSHLFEPHLTSIPGTSGQLVRENKVGRMEIRFLMLEIC